MNKKEFRIDAIDFGRMQQAATVAKRSTLHKHSTGSIIYDINDLMVSLGWSHYGEAIIQRYKQYRSVHAELHAILRSPTRDRLNGATIYVATIRNRSGNWGCGKPCAFCEQIISDVGIKKVVYTTGELSQTMAKFRP